MSTMKPKTEAKLDAAECSSCRAPIYWVELDSGKRMPLDRGADLRVIVRNGVGQVVRCYRSHFASCPNAKGHR